MATCLTHPGSAVLASQVPFLEGIVHFIDHEVGDLPFGKQPAEPAEKFAPPEAPKFGCDHGFPPVFDSAHEYRGVESAFRPTDRGSPERPRPRLSGRADAGAAAR